VATLAEKPMSSAIADADRMRTPLENTRRSPRLCSWRGRNLSRARMEASCGKPLKAVLAARIRIPAVKNVM